MNGLSAEPGERGRCGEIDLARCAPDNPCRRHRRARCAFCSRPRRRQGCRRLRDMRAPARQPLDRALQAPRRSSWRCGVACGARQDEAPRPDAARRAAWRGATTPRLRARRRAHRPSETTPSADHPRQHLVAAGFGRDRMAVGAQARGRLRQRHQKSGLRKIECRGLLAEIGERGRAHAFEIAAEWRERQIDRKDVVFRIALFELQRAHHLDELGAEAARTRFEQARRLHGERRRARHDMARARILKRGARTSPADRRPNDRRSG